MMGQPPENDVVPETESECPQLTTDWTSIYVCALLAFCSSVQFSLYFSSMWQYFLIVCFKQLYLFEYYIYNLVGQKSNGNILRLHRCRKYLILLIYN